MDNQAKATQVAKQILNSGKSVEEIVELIQAQSKESASIQLQILDGFNLAAQEQGQYAGGIPTLADEISDKLARNVKKYSKSAYKLSDRQVSVIIREIHGYRKV